MKRPVFVLFLLFVSALVFAAPTEEDAYNEYTIRLSDIPSDAPRFDEFPAKPWAGLNAPLNLRGDAISKMFRSRLEHWAKAKPNFAGHYILATWGCGTDCTQISIIDARTGEAFHPPGASSNVTVNIHQDLLDEGNLQHATGTIRFRPDSRLLILVGMPEERIENRGISYYVWDNGRLKRIRFVRKS